MPNRNVILYIAMSLDGYISETNESLDFLNEVQQEGEDYGYEAFTNSADTVIVGRRTYDWVMHQVPEFPHADKDTYVITRTKRPPVGNITFYTGSLKELIQNLKATEGKNIYCDGGAALVNELLTEDLIDEMIISVIPVLLGDGTRLFRDGRPNQSLTLLSAKSFEKGLVQLHYQRR